MRTFEDVIDDLMDRLGVDKKITVDLDGLNDTDKSVVEDSIKDFGYFVRDRKPNEICIERK